MGRVADFGADGVSNKMNVAQEPNRLFTAAIATPSAQRLRAKVANRFHGSSGDNSSDGARFELYEVLGFHCVTFQTARASCGAVVSVRVWRWFGFSPRPARRI